MANATAMCTSFKGELMTGTHILGTDALMAALYVDTASLGDATTAYAATSEVSGTGYTAGGVAVNSTVAPSTSGTAAIFTPGANIVYTGVTLSTAFDCVLIYNSTRANAAISTHTFGAQTITAGNFTINMPVNAVGTALLQLS